MLTRRACATLMSLIAQLRSSLVSTSRSGNTQQHGFDGLKSFESINIDMSCNVPSSGHSLLLGLPKELRLIIYEFVFAGHCTITIGQRTSPDHLLTDWSTRPGLTQTCSLIRQEASPVYFSSTHFVLNIQRSLCEDTVQRWICNSSEIYADAFQKISHVSVIAGTGIRQPPRQYTFLVQRNELVSVTDRLPVQRYTLPAFRWSPPCLDQVSGRLRKMRSYDERGFDVAQNLRGIIDVLARFAR